MLDLEVPEDGSVVRLIKRGKIPAVPMTTKKPSKAYECLSLTDSPLIDWYKAEGQYRHIKGSGTMEDIFADICKEIDTVAGK